MGREFCIVTGGVSTLGLNEVFGRIRNALEVKADATRPKTNKRTKFIH